MCLRIDIRTVKYKDYSTMADVILIGVRILVAVPV